MEVDKRSLEEMVHKLSIVQQTYQEMNLHEELLSLLLAKTDEVFLLLDEEGNIRAANPGCEPKLGFSASQMVGHQVAEFIHPEDVENFSVSFTTIKNVLRGDLIEFRFRHSAGWFVWMESVTKPISQEGHWQAYFMKLREVMNCRLIEEQLELKGKVFENALEGILITDLDGKILLVNPAFCQITGYSEEEVLGQNPRLLKSGVHPPEFFESMWDTLKQSGKWEGEIWNRNKTGEVFVEGASIRLITNEQGKAMYFASVFTDITKRIEEEEKLRQDLQLAKQVQKHVLSRPIVNQQIEIDATYLPSKALGGDMYAWYEIDHQRYGVILLDVVGHGVAASLISMSIRSLLGGLIKQLVCPELVMKELNRQMYTLYSNDEFSNDHFFTAIYVLIDTRNRLIEYCNAGHPTGLLATGNGEITQLDEGSVPIGLVRELPIKKHQIAYTDKSRLLLFTDGIVEPRMNSYEETLQSLQGSLLQNLKISNDHYLRKINRFYTERACPLEDDICVVSITIQ
ncbi:PAS domain S-box protein [Brevibacillus ginsengisoli]|uniref:PAS domain S-box protein n=1 Tax=Brevibacillus ginsengisoli TaxID=363854 RepID=UPI003CED7FFB